MVEVKKGNKKGTLLTGRHRSLMVSGDNSSKEYMCQRTPLSARNCWMSIPKPQRALSEPLPWLSRSSMLRATTKRSKAKSEASQLVRASPLQGEGRGFESLSAHHCPVSRLSSHFSQLMSRDIVPTQSHRFRHDCLCLLLRNLKSLSLPLFKKVF